MTTIKLKNGSGAPTAGDLVQGEPALDLTNKRLYTEDSGGTVIEVGTNPSTINIDAGTIDGAVIGGSSAAAITGTTITGTSFVSSGNMTFGDNDKAIFGAGSDLQIYHDGNNSRIVDAGTGYLKIQATDRVAIRSADDSEKMADFYANADVKLYYDNAQKFATTATGIDVTGTVTADGLTVEGSSSGTLNNVNFLNTNSGATTTANRIGLGITNSAGAAYTYIEANEDGIDAYPHLNFYTGVTATKRLEIEDNGDISFYEDTGTTAKFFWDASAESLGIGTSSPASNRVLHVSSSPQNQARFERTGAATVQIEFQDSTTTNQPSLGGDGDSLTFRTSFTERMRIDSSGRVGIGTSSPSHTLQAVDTSAGATTYAVVTDNSGASGTTVAGLGFANAGALKSSITAAVYGNDYMTFNVGGSGATERMRIDASGNVGIGTSSPSSNLHVKNTASNAEIKVETSGGLDAKLILDAPAASGAQSQIFFDASGTTAGSIQYTHNSGGTNFMTFHTGGSNTERMRIDSSGTLILSGNGGSTSNSIDISYNGTSGQGSFNVDSGSGNTFLTFGTSSSGSLSEAMRLDSSGNLLVGKTGTSVADTGVQWLPNGNSAITRSGGIALFLNRTSSDGSIVDFRKDNTSVGSIGAYSGNLIIAQASRGLKIQSDRFVPRDFDDTDANGVMDLGDSGNRFKDLYLSGGVYLGGTGSANLLDDYEEGTFTPTVYSSDNTTVLTSGVDYDLNDYRYVKVGRHVMMEVRIRDLRATKTDIFCTLPFTSLTSDSGVGITAEGDVIYLASNRLNFRKGTNQYPYGIVNFESS